MELIGKKRTQVEFDRNMRLRAFCNIPNLRTIEPDMIRVACRIIADDNDFEIKNFITGVLLREISGSDREELSIKVIKWLFDMHIGNRERRPPDEHMWWLARECAKMARFLDSLEGYGIQADLMTECVTVLTKKYGELKRDRQHDCIISD